MARTAGAIVENQWTRGLITEATGLNFPEHAATDADNVKFLPRGAVTRRLGIDIEGDARTLPFDENDGVIKEFVWEAVSQNGGYTFLVLQKGSYVHFFELEDGDTISAGLDDAYLDLREFLAPGGSNVENTPCSFDAGAGYLFIAHPSCEPVIVRWLSDEARFQFAEIVIQIRDFEGVEDDLGSLDNPDTLTDEHHYNLRNQGWDQEVRIGNVTNEVGTGGPLSPQGTSTSGGASNGPILGTTSGQPIWRYAL